MCPHNHIALDPFDITAPELPARSRLFALPPIGIGTAHMEGLASYVTRLARAHAVKPWRLLQDEFDKDGRLRSFWTIARYKNKLDGLGQTARIMSPIAMELTTVPEVRYLTLLPLSDLLPISCHQLLSEDMRWCPRCFATMIKEGQEPYRPLAWSFALYTVCHLHKSPLAAVCRHCGKKQKFLPDYPDLTLCCHCGSSLADRPTTGRSARVASLDLWIAASIGDLVAHIPELDGMPLRAQLAKFLGNAIHHLAGGSLRRFCAQLGLHLQSMDNFLRRERRVRLLRLLALAYGMDVCPAAMLIPDSKLPRTLRPLPPRLQKERKWQPLAEQRKKRIHEELTRVVADLDDTRSGLQVSKALGVAPHRLIYWFPAEYSAICARHAQAKKLAMAARDSAKREVVREAVCRIASRGAFPSIRQVAKEVRPHHVVLIKSDLMEIYRSALRECMSAAGSELILASKGRRRVRRSASV